MTEKLKTIDAETLLATPMKKTLFIVDTLIPQGVTVLSGASKIGKSWMMLWLGLQISQGLPVWGLSSVKCDVLYLTLEDTPTRIKDRLYDLTDGDAPKDFHFAVCSQLIGNGLEEQLLNFIAEFPNTKLIIIDTLQKVRDSKGSSGRAGMYGNDYDDISSIKKIADSNGIGIILVHHLRKLPDSSDPFNEISGSTGIAGAADTNMILKRRRSDDNATLLISGRDVEYQELTLKFDNLVWTMTERIDSAEIHRREIPAFLFRLVDFMKTKSEWKGTATELVEAMNESEIAANTVTKHLGYFALEVLEPAGIEYSTGRTGKARFIKFKKSDSNDTDDSKTAI